MKYILNKDNYNTKHLFESAIPKPVLVALRDWKNANVPNSVLIGGVAMSFYVDARETMDVDALFLSKSDIPTHIDGFKRTRPSAFQHNQTHVEIELITASHINISQSIVDKVIETASDIDGLKVASPSGIIALKLGRFIERDIVDIKKLITFGEIDLSPFNLSKDLMDRFNSLNGNTN